MKVLVLLFFQRLNFGDDLFELAYRKIFNENQKIVMQLADASDIQKIEPDVDCILFGGGDMLVDFFLNPLKRLIDQNPQFQGPIYGWSQGLPYASVSECGSLDMFDHISCRSMLDKNIIAKRLGNESSSFWPDISTILDWVPAKRSHLQSSSISKASKIGISFPYDLVKDKVLFDKVTERLFRIIKKLHDKNPNLEFVWIPFSLSLESKSNDANIEKDASQKLEKSVLEKCRFIKSYQTMNEMNALFNDMDLVICGRFHAHIVAIMTNTPFISIGQSPKVKKLLEETGLFSNSAEGSRFFEKIEWTLSNYSTCVEKLREVSQAWKTQSSAQIDSLVSMIQESKRRACPPYYVSPSEYKLRSNLLESILNSIDDKFFQKDKKESIELAKQSKANFYDVLVQDLDQDEQEKVKGFLAETICLHLTGKRDPPYLWGLSQQIMQPNFKFYESFDWLQKDWFSKHFYLQNHSNVPDPIWSVQWFEKNSFKGSHRCGWEFVVNRLEHFGKYPEKGKLPNSIAKDTLILDTYCDRTFGWENRHFVALGILPYKRPWVGFFHHTFDTRFQNNMSRSCSYPSFIQSLDQCVCFFVLSNALKRDLEKELKTIASNFKLEKIPPVHFVHHPTDLNVPSFSFEKFVENNNKMLVQIGAWLRNPYGIYRVPIEMQYKDDVPVISDNDGENDSSFSSLDNCERNPKKLKIEKENDKDDEKLVPNSYQNPLGIKKAILKGSNMDNYFRPGEFHLLGTTGPNEIKIDFCRCFCVCDRESDKQQRYLTGHLCDCEFKSFNNQFLFGFLQSLNEDYESVTILNKLNNQDYDKLLTENIVFLNLYDASAANTVIECIARNTPLLVNPLPAVVEYLGKDYPFYYRSFREAADKATDPNLIFKTYYYLKNMEKSFLHIDSFLFQVGKFIREDSKIQ